MGPEVVVSLGLFGMVAFVIWVVVTSWQRRHSLHERMLLQERLLDRLESGQDLVAVLQTEAGERLMTGALNGEPPLAGTASRVLGAVHSGIVLIALGAGLVSVGLLFDSEVADTLSAMGVIAGFVGGGFLVSALSCHRLATALAPPESRPLSALDKPPDQTNHPA